MIRSLWLLPLLFCLGLLMGCPDDDPSPQVPPLLLDLLVAGVTAPETTTLEVGQSVAIEALVDNVAYSNITYKWTDTSPTGAVTPTDSRATTFNAGTTLGTFFVSVEVRGTEVGVGSQPVVGLSAAVKVVESTGPLEPGDAIQSVSIGGTNCPKGDIIDFVGGQTYQVVITPKGPAFDPLVEYNAQVGTVTATGTFTADWVVPNTPGLKGFFVQLTSAPTAGGTPTVTEFSFVANITAP